MVSSRARLERAEWAAERTELRPSFRVVVVVVHRRSRGVVAPLSSPVVVVAVQAATKSLAVGQVETPTMMELEPDPLFRTP